MASGSAQGTGRYMQAKITWSSTKGTGGSTVSATLIAQNTESAYFAATLYGGYNLTINGNQVTGTNKKLSGSINGAVTLLTHSVWVPYTGEKSITISGWIGSNGIYCNGTNIGNKSVSLTAKLDKVGSAPTAPTVKTPTTATVSEATTTASITWTAGTSYNNAGNYCLEVSQNGGAWTAVTSSIAWSATSYTYTLPTKTQGTKYQFRVRSKNDIGYSGYSTSGTITLNALSAPAIGTLSTFNPYLNATCSIPLSGGSQSSGEVFMRMASVSITNASGSTTTWSCTTPSNGNTSVSVSISAASMLTALGKARGTATLTATAWTQNSRGARSSNVTKTFTVNINSDGAATPTLGAATISGGLLGKTASVFLAGVNNLVVSSPAATLRRAPSDATVTYTVACTGKTTLTGQSVTFSSLAAGQKTITVTATDSRGYSVSTSKKIYVQSYYAPSISNFTAVRLDETPTSALVNYTTKYCPVYEYADGATAGTQLNAINTNQYTGGDVSAWTDIGSVPKTIAGLATDSKYPLQIRIADKVKTTTYTTVSAVIPTIKTTLAIRDERIGINCVPQSPYALEVEGQVRFSEGMSLPKIGINCAVPSSYQLQVNGPTKLNAVSATSTDVTGEIIGRNHIRMINGNYGVFFRNDGSNFYLLSTASGQQTGTWNALRPFHFNLSTGKARIGNGLDLAETTSVHPVGSSWIDGGRRTDRPAFWHGEKQDDSYDAFYNTQTQNNGYLSFGGIQNKMGFWYYDPSRTTDGTDGSAYYEANDKTWRINGNVGMHSGNAETYAVQNMTGRRLRIHAGTITVTLTSVGTSDYFTMAVFNKLFGVSNCAPTNVCIVGCYGTDASSMGCSFGFWRPGNCLAMTPSPSFTGDLPSKQNANKSVRINYIAIYFG